MFFYIFEKYPCKTPDRASDYKEPLRRSRIQVTDAELDATSILEGAPPSATWMPAIPSEDVAPPGEPHISRAEDAP